MDRAVTKGVIHKRQAANRKSGIMKLANTIVTAEDIAAYQPKEKKAPVASGNKKAAAKAARKEAMAAASAEKAKRREKTLKEEAAAAKRKAEEEAAAAAEEEATEEAAEYLFDTYSGFTSAYQEQKSPFKGSFVVLV